MKSRLLISGALIAVVAIAGCGKKHNARADVVECSSISLDAKGTAQCLVQLHRWKVADANRAANNRQHELDSLKAWHEDSAWAVESAKHRKDLQSCRQNPAELNNCLLAAGWPLSRANATTDSLWKAELPQHRHELEACMNKREMNLSSCLTLYYKWDSDRALATADSVARVRLGGHR